MVPEPGDPQSLNRYAYVLNNPLRYNDPSGHCPWCIGAAIGAVVGAVVGAATAAVPQMIQNVRDGQPLTANIDPGEVGKAFVTGLVAGAVVGGTLGWGASAVGLVGAGEGGTALVSSATAMEASATAEAAATAACADGDCTNEVQEVTQAISWVNQSVPQGARLIARWGPATGEGPLGEEIASTFRGGSYSELILTEDTTFYRVYGGSAREISSWWSRLQPRGALQSQIDLALLPEWGNTAEEVATILVPKGTIVYEGFAAPQAGLIGGGSQVFIPTVSPAWLIE